MSKMSSSFIGDTKKEKLLFVIVFGAIITALLFPSYQLSRIQEFMLKQNQQIIDNSNRNYMAELNQSKAGVIRTAALLNDNQRIVQNLTTQLKDRQDIDEKILTTFSTSNAANNKTLTKLGGFESLIRDIHQSRMQAEHNSALINSTFTKVKSLESALPSKQNNIMLHQIIAMLTTHSANPQTVQLFQPIANNTNTNTNGTAPIVANNSSNITK
jgi:hypothetical protein